MTGVYDPFALAVSSLAAVGGDGVVFAELLAEDPEEVAVAGRGLRGRGDVDPTKRRATRPGTGPGGRRPIVLFLMTILCCYTSMLFDVIDVISY